MQSEYLSDQGKRAHLLDYLASMYEGIADLSGELLSLDHGGMDEAAEDASTYRATTAAMNILADWVMIEPMLTDIYAANVPADIPGNK